MSSFNKKLNFEINEKKYKAIQKKTVQSDQRTPPRERDSVQENNTLMIITKTL